MCGFRRTVRFSHRSISWGVYKFPLKLDLKPSTQHILYYINKLSYESEIHYESERQFESAGGIVVDNPEDDPPMNVVIDVALAHFIETR